MDKNMQEEMDPREQAALKERNKKIMDQVDPMIEARSLENDSQFDELSKNDGNVVDLYREDGRPGGEEIRDKTGNVLFERGIYYKRSKDESNQYHDTDEIGAVAERLVDIQAKDDQGRITEQTVRGRRLDIEHGYETKQTIDPNEANGKYKIISEVGKTLEGDEKGTTWNNSLENKENGEFKIRIRHGSGEHYYTDENNQYELDENGQRTFGEFTSYKVNYEHPAFVTDKNPDGCILYYSIEYGKNGEERPHKFLSSMVDTIPEDFPELELVQLINEKRQAKESAIAARQAAKEGQE